METRSVPEKKIEVVRHLPFAKIKVNALSRMQVVKQTPLFLPKFVSKSCERPCIILRYKTPSKSHVQVRIFARTEYLLSLKVGEYAVGEAAIVKKKVGKKYYQNIDIILQRVKKKNIPILFIPEKGYGNPASDQQDIFLNPKQQQGSIIVSYK